MTVRMWVTVLVGALAIAFSLVGCVTQYSHRLRMYPCHLSKHKDNTRVRGLRIELVNFDPAAKTATIRTSSVEEPLTAEEGGYFGTGSGIQLVRVSDEGVDSMVFVCDSSRSLRLRQ